VEHIVVRSRVGFASGEDLGGEVAQYFAVIVISALVEKLIEELWSVRMMHGFGGGLVHDFDHRRFWTGYTVEALAEEAEYGGFEVQTPQVV
jgi:hypothetical protein